MRTTPLRFSMFFVTITLTIFLLMIYLGSSSNRIARASFAVQPAMPAACPSSFTVNSLLDTADAAPGDMVCDTGGGVCTLRAAIQEANALVSCGVIDFDFSVSGTINTTGTLSIGHSVNVNGPGANLLTVAGNNSAVVFDLPNSASVASLNGLTITGGNGASLVAGGINNSSTLTINRCQITGNTGKFSGAIQNFKLLTILDSTISNNTAILSGFNNAGGISQSNNGTLIVTNSTISGNTASATGNSNGGVLIFDGTAVITGSTITDNQAGASGAGGLMRNFGSITVRNSIIAANRNNSTVADVGGGLTSMGYNLVGNAGSESFTQTGDQAGTGASPLDPVLGSLANNGGPTPTHALMGGSTAIDKGSSFGSTTDQRGLPRIFDDPNISPALGGDNTDIGAFEAQTILPSLGNYPNTIVALSANATITPDAAPGLATSISVSTSTNFKGTLTADPATGLVKVTNAHPAGSYIVRVKSFGPSGMASKISTLTVQSVAPCADPLAFINAPDVAVNSFPTSVTVGDFNEDGHQDFVTGYDSFDPVSIRFGDGAGNFSGTTTVSADPFVRSIAVGDFNGDGHQDLAIASNGGLPTVSIRLGDGAGNFSGTTTVDVGLRPQSIAIAGFNGDGHQDFATANSIDNTVSIRLGDGAGNFSGATEISVGVQPLSVAVGDFNNDGKQDFAAANNGANTVSIRLGDGLGGFTSVTDVVVNSSPRSVAVGDFNGNGAQDLAVSDEGVNAVSIRLGDGSGSFTSAPDVAVSSGPRSVGIGDFNNDGNQDFVTANIGFGTLSLRLGDGAGNFTGFTPASEVTVGTNPTFVAVGDFNSDDRQDFVVVHFNTSNLAAIRLNNSCPPPNSPPTITASGPLTRQQAAAAINSKIATVNDVDQAENSLMVTAAPATGTGVTVSNLVVAANGDVTADVAAGCGATNSTFTLTVTDNMNVTAIAILTVNVTGDSQPPVIACPANITQVSDANSCDAVVMYNTPSATDNCPGASAACSPPSGSTFSTGTTTVTCTATDASGNTASCQFTVTVTDNQPPSLTCPANITTGSDANSCDAVVTYNTPTPTDNCPGASVACSPPSGSTFSTGTTTVTCTATDASGNTTSCQFTVTVNDTQPPSLTCPANITTGSDANSCDAVVTYSNPVPTDNCPGASVACSPPAGSAFPKGTTTVLCTATDTSGNTASCQFTVTVVDNQLPSITCPADIIATAPAGQCNAAVSFAPMASDNCAVSSIVCLPPSGSAFPIGTTVVTCKAIDTSGNTSSNCAFAVKVVETQKPVITCPPNIVLKTPNPGQPAAVVNFAQPTASDNCGTPTVVCSPASGSAFPVGTTVVTCTATDQSGNQAGCSFVVTVFDFVIVVTVFDFVIKDDTTNTFILLNSTTGDYEFLDCSKGLRMTGKAVVTKSFCKIEIKDGGPDPKISDRNVMITINPCTRVATGTIRPISSEATYRITDSNIANNPTACS